MGLRMTTATIRKQAICVNCEKLNPIHALGLCRKCWIYQWRHGEPRPDRLINPPLFCTDCKENYAKIKGKCRQCSDSRKHTGRKRRKYVRDRDVVCRNQKCRKPLRFDRHPTGGKCYNCYVYSNQTPGQARPLRLCRFLLEPGYVYCKNPNCDQVLKETSSNRRGGRCHNCYTWKRHSPETERPREYCPQRVEWGWCDGCGEIAVVEVELNIGLKANTKIKMPLCQAHYEQVI